MTGLPERLNADNEELGYERTRDAFQEAASRAPEAIIDHLLNIGDEWAGGREQDDDVSFVVLKMKDAV